MTPDVLVEEDAASLRARAQLASLCARLLADEIDAPLYRALARSPFAGGAAAPDGPWVSVELGALGEEQALEGLAVEYCRLFVGPEPACPPYQSAFRGEALLGARHAERVQEVAARWDLEVVLPARIVSVDHIAVQLSLWAAALVRARDPRTPNLAADDIMERVLQPWLPDYLSALSDAARLAPYTKLPALLRAAMPAR